MLALAANRCNRERRRLPQFRSNKQRAKSEVASFVSLRDLLLIKAYVSAWRRACGSVGASAARRASSDS